jgi:hypothetical protein
MQRPGLFRSGELEVQVRDQRFDFGEILNPVFKLFRHGFIIFVAAKIKRQSAKNCHFEKILKKFQKKSGNQPKMIRMMVSVAPAERRQ